MAIKQRMTLEEFLELPEEEPALEFEDGMVTQKVPPQGKHALLQTGIVAMLNGIARQEKLALALTELRTTFAGSSRVPDIAVYRWERIPRDASGEIANDFREPPDLAIEIVSPGQSVTALTRRCVRFLAEGVKTAMIVDPARKTVLVFRHGDVRSLLDRGQELDLSDVIPGLRLAVGAIFDVLKLE